MNDKLGEFLESQRKEDDRTQFRMAMERARNTMRAVRVMVQEGEYDEAIEAITEALGDEDEQ